MQHNDLQDALAYLRTLFLHTNRKGFKLRAAECLLHSMRISLQ